MSMTPEDVIAALAAHAAQVDFRRPDPLVMAARAEKIGKARPVNWRTFFGDDKLPAIRSAAGRGDRGVRKETRHEVAADALAGMPKKSWQTLQTAIGIDTGAREAVVARLTREAWRSQLRDRFWPAKVDRKRCPCKRAASPWYADDLVELAVLQLEHPIQFRTHDARAEWFGLSNRHWRNVMQQPFDLLSGHVWSWYAGGIGHLERRLSRRRRKTA